MNLIIFGFGMLMVALIIVAVTMACDKKRLNEQNEM